MALKDLQIALIEKKKNLDRLIREVKDLEDQIRFAKPEDTEELANGSELVINDRSGFIYFDGPLTRWEPQPITGDSDPLPEYFLGRTKSEILDSIRDLEKD